MGKAVPAITDDVGKWRKLKHRRDRLRTSIEIDDASMAEALETGGPRTKPETVAAALELFVQRRRREAGHHRAQLDMRRFEGRVESDGDLEDMRGNR